MTDTPKHCETCKHRNEAGYCTNSKLNEDIGQKDGEKLHMLIYDYSEGGGFWVGPTFGCVHHEPARRMYGMSKIGISVVLCAHDSEPISVIEITEKAHKAWARHGMLDLYVIDPDDAGILLIPSRRYVRVMAAFGQQALIVRDEKASRLLKNGIFCPGYLRPPPDKRARDFAESFLRAIFEI